jgi:hypothetical protein
VLGSKNIRKGGGLNFHLKVIYEVSIGREYNDRITVSVFSTHILPVHAVASAGNLQLKQKLHSCVNT